METFLIRAAQLLLSLSILVFLHELGHFGFARLFKVRVDKFYVFFNPKFSLVRWKKIRGKWQFKFFAPNVPYNERPKLDADGDEMKDARGNVIMEQIPLDELADDDWRKYPESTEWGIGWVPLGGFCKIAGMIDESMDTTSMKSEPKPWEYRSRPVWQRMFIITGGVLVNFILALAIYSAILFTWGKEYLPVESAKYGYEYSQSLLNAGFKHGDRILKINDNPVDNQSEIAEKLLIDGNRDVTVFRDGEVVELRMPKDLSQQILANGDNNMFMVRFPFVVASVAPASPAEAAKLQPRDSVVGINGESMFIFQDISKTLAQHKGETIVLDFYRNGQLQQADIALTEEGKLGVAVQSYFEILPTKKEEYGFFESIPAGINYGWETLTSYVKQFKIVFTKEGAKQLGGFGAIGSLFPPSWNWQAFWSLTAFLSIILAFMNILPIPGLDGGYLLFLIYEGITRRKPSERFMEYATMIGFFLLIALVVYANGNDIIKAIFR